jgi:5-methylthioadenosine/S-adenosylhomocysteine deaminase
MLLRNKGMLSFRDLSVRQNSNVLIDGPRVQQVGHNLPPKNRVTDGSGCYLTPGLLNAQSHATMMQLGSVAQDIIVEYLFNKHICMYEKNLTPHDSYACTLLGEAECAQRLTRPATAQPLHTR